MGKKRGGAGPEDPALLAYQAGRIILEYHPLTAAMLRKVRIVRDPSCPLGPHGWAYVDSNGVITVHPTRRGEPAEWAYVIAHGLMHLAFDHFQDRPRRAEWQAAACCAVHQFLGELKLGRPPAELSGPLHLGLQDEERLYQRFCQDGIPDDLRCGVAGPEPDMRVVAAGRWHHPENYPALFAQGIAQAVDAAVEAVAGTSRPRNLSHQVQRAREWLINHYPLLGALLATFTIVEDPTVCARLDISIAAVDPEAQEIFINPAAGLTEGECRFVLAHELLHVGLRHDTRRQGRDAQLWNVACDYVINGWLVEMDLGDMPRVGLLHDPALKGESAESVYDTIIMDMRRFRKLGTFRGVGLGDMLERGRPEWWRSGEGLTLDEYYRRAMAQGLQYHQDAGRGFLPAGLVEEIRALAQPPIPWDVALANWFDHHFPPVETRRSYARLSRRQAAAPEIPMPARVPPLDPEAARTFGVVLDTSGSMDRTLLAKALGTIASYSLARDVPAVRVVYCDASAYDQGYMPPEQLLDRVQVRGRGGTILQPGVDLLEAARDFPPDGPLLIITDGGCDVLRVRRDHAYVMPAGATLPFPARGPVFRVR